MTEVAEQFTENRAGEIARITHWIDGKPVEGTSGRSGPVFNPATGDSIGTFPRSGADDRSAASSSGAGCSCGSRGSCC